MTYLDNDVDNTCLTRSYFEKKFLGANIYILFLHENYFDK